MAEDDARAGEVLADLLKIGLLVELHDPVLGELLPVRPRVVLEAQVEASEVI